MHFNPDAGLWGIKERRDEPTRQPPPPSGSWTVTMARRRSPPKSERLAKSYSGRMEAPRQEAACIEPGCCSRTARGKLATVSSPPSDRGRGRVVENADVVHPRRFRVAVLDLLHDTVWETVKDAWGERNAGPILRLVDGE